MARAFARCRGDGDVTEQGAGRHRLRDVGAGGHCPGELAHRLNVTFLAPRSERLHCEGDAQGQPRFSQSASGLVCFSWAAASAPTYRRTGIIKESQPNRPTRLSSIFTVAGGPIFRWSYFRWSYFRCASRVFRRPRLKHNHVMICTYLPTDNNNGR